jgi:membrane associated rhomboid family serine protease
VKVKKADLDVDGQFYFKPDRIDESEAREEGYWGSLCLCLCPTISWRQFIVWISIVEIIFFIISCCIYGVRNETFLAPDPHALEILGWQDAKKIKNDW